VLPLWPRFVYAGLELAALVACLLLYVRICRRQPGTGPVLALIPVVFAWRSLFTYFYVALPMLSLWVFLALAVGSTQNAVGRKSASHCLLPTAYCLLVDEDDTREQAERPAAA
jgi:hypothetical protein